MQYYYDGQIRRYLIQFIRMFSAFTVQKGKDNLGNYVYDQVPCRYGDISRHAAHVLRNNSENTLNTVPIISCYITALSMLENLRKYPQYEETIQVLEKKFNETTQAYESEIGQTYQVTRYQPVPYKLTMSVDVWASNSDQKLQLMEQILVLFNPGVNLHTNDNALDWTALAYCELTDINWSSRSMPSGADDVIDIATLTFDIPILINPPSKVQKQNVIHTILSKLHVPDTADFDSWTIDNLSGAWTDFSVVTLENYKIRYENGQALLLERSGADQGGDGSVLTWANVLDNYGEIKSGISQLRLRQGTDITDPDNDVVGTIQLNSGNPQILDVTIDTDTITADTQGTVIAIVDPQVNGPGDGTLASAISGQRYMVLSDVPSGGAWGTVAASKNDIITYNGSNWVVAFDASASPGPEYTTNTTTNYQYEWTGDYWQNSYEGSYDAGWWRIRL